MFEATEIQKQKTCSLLIKSCIPCQKEKKESFFEIKANTERYRKSSIPYMQKLLNQDNENLKKD